VAGLRDHGWRQVQPGDVPGDAGDFTGDQARPARHIENIIAGRDARGAEQEPVDLCVVAGVQPRERLRLAGELVQDRSPLFVERHVGGLLPWGWHSSVPPLDPAWRRGRMTDRNGPDDGSDAVTDAPKSTEPPPPSAGERGLVFGLFLAAFGYFLYRVFR